MKHQEEMHQEEQILEGMLKHSVLKFGLKMKEVLITKKATASNSKDPLENFSKLSSYAKKSSALAKRQAKVNGIAFTIIKNKKVYKVFPDGKK
jgi:hypothetical protein